MDKIDCKILQLITENAKIPFQEVGDICGISRTAVHQRVQKLVDEKVLLGSGFNVDLQKLGYQVCTYIGIKLDKASRYKDVLPALSEIPELVECHFTTGPYTLLVKLYARDTQHLMQLLNGKIQEIPGVSETETLMSLDEPINRCIKIENIE